MKMNKRTYGLLCVLTGYILFILIIDSSSKPTDVGISLKPIESLETYFFGFVWGLGNLGWLIGSVLLIGFLIVFYFIGVWLYKITYSNNK